MLRDAKNAEFKDQIYYALAGIEFNEGNEPKGIDTCTNVPFILQRIHAKKEWLMNVLAT